MIHIYNYGISIYLGSDLKFDQLVGLIQGTGYVYVS